MPLIRFQLTRMQVIRITIEGVWAEVNPCPPAHRAVPFDAVLLCSRPGQMPPGHGSGHALRDGCRKGLWLVVSLAI